MGGDHLFDVCELEEEAVEVASQRECAAREQSTLWGSAEVGRGSGRKRRFGTGKIFRGRGGDGKRNTGGGRKFRSSETGCDDGSGDVERESNMLSFTGGLKIYVAVEPCDMRKGFEGLMAMANNQMGGEIRLGTLYVFSNKRRSRLKILYCDGSGLWLMTKRLEAGTFSWPQGEEKVVNLRPEAFAMLTDGVDLQGGKMRPWYDRKTGDK